MTNERVYRWAIPLILCIFLGMPTLFGSFGAISLLSGHTLQGAVFLLSPVAFAAWYIWDTRHSWEEPGELLRPMAKAWAAGILLGGIAWLLVESARLLLQAM